MSPRGDRTSSVHGASDAESPLVEGAGMTLQGPATVAVPSRIKRAGPIALAVAVVSALGALASAAPAHAAAATCHGAKATIVGTQSSNVIRGTAGRDVIAGLGGNDTIHGGGGND